MTNTGAVVNAVGFTKNNASFGFRRFFLYRFIEDRNERYFAQRDGTIQKTLYFVAHLIYPGD